MKRLILITLVLISTSTAFEAHALAQALTGMGGYSLPTPGIGYSMGFGTAPTLGGSGGMGFGPPQRAQGFGGMGMGRPAPQRKNSFWGKVVPFFSPKKRSAPPRRSCHYCGTYQGIANHTRHQAPSVKTPPRPRTNRRIVMRSFQQ